MSFVQVGILVEFVLIALAIGLSLLGVHDPKQPLQQLNAAAALSGLLWGILFTIPLLGFLVALHFSKRTWLKSLRRFSDEVLKPLFKNSTIFGLAMLSIAAGFGEEIFFRWCLQGGISGFLEPKIGGFVATCVGLIVASIIFGLCHAASWQYFTITLIGGLYLGLAMIWTGNWLVPAVAHALYDFVALLYIVKMPNELNMQTESQT
jgi:membrane protease YdiL (CAAX protease family)